MHELGVVFHIIDSLEKVAIENEVEKIQSVTVEVGEVSTVIPHYLTDCWKWAVQKKPLMIDCCLLYTSPSPRDRQKSRMPSSA